MQTLHLRFRALRAISLRQGLSRWRTPSDARRAGMKGPPGLSQTLQGQPAAVGSRPASIAPAGLARCPTVGAGLPEVSPLREVSCVGSERCRSRYRVCPWQTASDLAPYPAPHEAGDLGADHWQARASESQRLTSAGCLFPSGPSVLGRGPPTGKKTADPVAHVGAWAGFNLISSGARLHGYSHYRGLWVGRWPATISP